MKNFLLLTALIILTLYSINNVDNVFGDNVHNIDTVNVQEVNVQEVNVQDNINNVGGEYTVTKIDNGNIIISNTKETMGIVLPKKPFPDNGHLITSSKFLIELLNIKTLYSDWVINHKNSGDGDVDFMLRSEPIDVAGYRTDYNVKKYTYLKLYQCFSVRNGEYNIIMYTDSVENIIDGVAVSDNMRLIFKNVEDLNKFQWVIM